MIELKEAFFKTVCKHAPLSRDDESALWGRIRSGDIKARDKMLLHNMRMVAAICRGYSGRGVPIVDLYVEGFLGLHEAVKRFKPALNFKFTSYAVWWIRQKIVMALANGQLGYSRPIGFFMEQRAIRRGAEVSESVAARVERLALGVVSSDTIIDFIADAQPGPEADAERSDLAAKLSAAVHKLKGREFLIISLFFGLGDTHPHNLREVSERVGLSRERVRQIKQEALAKLRRMEGVKEVCRTK